MEPILDTKLVDRTNDWGGKKLLSYITKKKKLNQLYICSHLTMTLQAGDNSISQKTITTYLSFFWKILYVSTGD